MNISDDYGFWDDERDRSHLPGVALHDRPQRRRSSSSTAARRRPQRPSRPRAAEPNPLIRRLGALCAIGLVAVPVAFVVRGSDSAARVDTAGAAGAATDDSLAAAGIAIDPAVIVSVVPAAAATVAPATAAPVDAAADVAAAAAPADAAAPAGVSESSAGAGGAARVAAASAVVAVDAVESKRTCAVSYKVQAGDYWISLAKRAGIKLGALLKANGATVNTPLYPGRMICLPAGTVMSPAPAASSPTTATTNTAAAPAPTATTTKPKSSSTTAPATTQAPVTTAAPTTTTEPRPKNNYTRAQVEQIIRSVWPDDLEDEAVRIATRESNLIPTVRNSCCYGLFQIHFTANQKSLVSWGITSASALYDPQVNAFAAYAMYLRAGGWGPWAL